MTSWRILDCRRIPSERRTSERVSERVSRPLAFATHACVRWMRKKSHFLDEQEIGQTSYCRCRIRVLAFFLAL